MLPACPALSGTLVLHRKLSGQHKQPLLRKEITKPPLVTCRSTSASEVSTVPASTTSGSGPSSSGDKDIRLYYRTQWGQAWVHGSVAGGPWKDYPLKKVPSAPGKWLMGTISPNGTTGAAEALATFVVTDKTNWDKPPDGGNYIISAPGTYTLQSGAVSAVQGKPVMVVSDLDGTMVGDDAATGAFKHWWEETGVPRGGVLVYNTGRSLDSFLGLMRDKGHCLAHPDALISAVGTKVYQFDGSSWREDAAWSKLLDQGWNLNAVREACYKALAQAGKEVMHFRPKEEQNTHKVTCGVADAAVAGVLASIGQSLEASGVKANVISSGHGGWKYVDIVPLGAGKLEALNYVRQRHAFPAASTVACGDSGNDILMMTGQNLAIVVGNAQPDLRNWLASRQGAEEALPDGKQRLRQVKAHEAHGILEGLEYWGFK